MTALSYVIGDRITQHGNTQTAITKKTDVSDALCNRNLPIHSYGRGGCNNNFSRVNTVEVDALGPPLNIMSQCFLT